MGVAIKLPAFRGRREEPKAKPAGGRRPSRAAPQKRRKAEEPPRKVRKSQANAKGATRKVAAAPPISTNGD